MNLLALTQLGEDRLEVSWQRPHEPPQRCGRSVSVRDPMSDEDRKELRWYLEGYLDFPYGAEKWRAAQVEAKMERWGEALFQQVFPREGPDPTPRALYDGATREGLDHCELCLNLKDPALLGLPWELIRNPAEPGRFLAPLLGGLYRSRGAPGREAPPEPRPGGPFRILLVVARPYGGKDIPLSTVARPLLAALRPLRPCIQVDLLRPPTFEALARRLNERRGRYHLVHFDGHGVFARPWAGRGVGRSFSALADRGHLVFEKKDGSPDLVNSQDLGQALATSRVPLFVLNACQSAEEGQRDPFSSVAAQLVATGARGVVAMSYSVYADAAARFMQRFYEELVGHAPLGEAVAAARLSLFTDPGRESVAGTLQLRDWMVPALYQREPGYVPLPEGPAVTPTGDLAEKGRFPPRPVAEECPEGRFGFVGRDYDVLRLERALRDDDSPWVLLWGMGGVGKTALAYGFARWFHETGGCPGGVFAASFRHQASLGQVVGSMTGYGTDFSRLSEEEQWRQVVDHLHRNPCLLAWDNFETVAGYPVGATPLASEEEQEKLARFLQALRGGRSRVLITTRKPGEDWLGVGYGLIEVGGLTPQDAAQLARSILKTVARSPEDFRDDADYARLLQLLRGHPGSLEVVLPHLRKRSPGEIIEDLHHRLGPLHDVLDHSLAYAFTQLSERARRHMPFVGLFAGCVLLDTLKAFVCAGDEREAACRRVMGEGLDADGWQAVLEEAAAVGLVRSLAGGLYELHPTFPAFLRQALEAAVGVKGLEQLEAEFRSFYADLGAALLDGMERAEPAATLRVAVEEPNLLRALRLAQMGEEWAPALAIVPTMGVFYEKRGRWQEWDALRTALLRWIGHDASPGAPRDRVGLWMYLLSSEANRALERNDLLGAEEAYNRILSYLTSLDDPNLEPYLATGYHHLGLIASDRQQFDQAEAWYRKALEVFERLRLERDAVGEYHHLGIIAQERAQFDRAEAFYRKALHVAERLGLREFAAREYHHLGIIAAERHQFDRAEEFYRQALKVFKDLGLRADAAFEYHHLGLLAEERQAFDRAEKLYRKALGIFERLRLDRGIAGESHQLGIIAEEGQRFNQAEQWYRRALEIEERLGLEREAASTYHQLGINAQKRQQFDQAEQSYERALEIRERLGLERDAAPTYHQLGMIAQERRQFDRAEHLYHKSLEICERLGLEREAASTYHQLGMIAQERRQFDRAEQLYHKALEICERLGHPPLCVSPLFQMGVLRCHQARLREAVSWFGRALAISIHFRMRVTSQILQNLSRLATMMGARGFTKAWQAAFEGQDPPPGLNLPDL